MKKHKKILKNFNFKKMIEKANVKGSELNKRIERFNQWVNYSRLAGIRGKISFNKKKYCFEQYFCGEIDSTECKNKYIGNYIYKNYSPDKKIDSKKGLLDLIRFWGRKENRDRIIESANKNNLGHNKFDYN